MSGCPAPTFPGRCFALSQEQTRRAAGCSGRRQVYRQLLAYGFYVAGVSLQHLRDVDSESLPAAPVRPEGGYDMDLAVRWQAQSERGDVQGTALWLATFAYEREHMAEVASRTDLSEEDELVLSRWQADICYDEEEAGLRLVELLDPELALRLKQCGEAQDIPAEPADA